MNSRDLNAGLGRAGLDKRGRYYAQTPDDIDRYDQYQDPLPGIDKVVSIMITAIAATGFSLLLILLWWVSQP
jgi:hypothetical protein